MKSIDLDREIALELMDIAHDQGGDVQAPGGYFCVVEIPANMKTLEALLEFYSEETTARLVLGATVNPVAGWYVLVQNEQGQIDALLASGEDEALEEFAERQSTYHDWLDALGL